ncbi:MAG: hypothetical protein PF501_13425 [Salinisphaera sp.]|jgi:hypothetical protein|nr:hypothetical protein [Salinisphaera sp.]
MIEGLPEPAVMRWQPRRFLPALIPILLGLFWLWAGWRSGWLVGILACLPGVVLIGTGAGQLLWAGDRHLGYHMALAGPASSVLALLLWFWLGLWPGLMLLAGGPVTFLVAGLVLRIQHPVPPAVRPPATGIKVLAKMATDAALLGFFVNCARIPRGRAVETDLRELDALGELLSQRGWDHNPAAAHGEPVAPVAPSLRRARAAGRSFEWLTFASRYTPDPALPGCQRWHAHRPNRTAAARVLRHAGAPRPWLMCVHGYRMGLSGLDFQLFDVDRLHHELGLNVVMPILPLHGVRSVSRLSGGLFLDGPMADLFHGQSQALTDLRSCLAWVRNEQPGASVGAIGFSLGGYSAALLSAFEPDLACVIAGIPMTDIPGTLWQHLPTAHARYLEASGLTAETVSARLRPVSPLALEPQVPASRRYIFAATADQLVSPDQPLRLWQHWGQCPIQWYDGSHLSVRHEVDIGPFINSALVESGLLTRS